MGDMIYTAVIDENVPNHKKWIHYDEDCISEYGKFKKHY